MKVVYVDSAKELWVKRAPLFVLSFVFLLVVMDALFSGELAGRAGNNLARSESPVAFFVFIVFYVLMALYSILTAIRKYRLSDK